MKPRRFIFRTGLLIAPLLIFAVFGAVRLAGYVLDQFGIATPVFLHAAWPVWIAARFAFIGLLFVLVMRRVGRPLGDVVNAADRVGEGDFSVRVREHGPPWIRSMARAFNGMTSSLEQQHRQRREMMADIAHELRTPLAVMQGRLEGMLDGVYPRDERQVAQVLDDARHLARLVEDLRTLAHTESGTLKLEREPVDIGVLLEEVAAFLQPEADPRGISIRVAGEGQMVADVDAVRLREVVSNLASNAIRYSPAHGVVVIEGDATDDTVTIRIRDSGPGIPSDELTHIFDRFHKGAASTGSGLGLTIAHNLVTAHGGTIRAESREGAGTTMIVTLQKRHAESSDSAWRRGEQRPSDLRR